MQDPHTTDAPAARAADTTDAPAAAAAPADIPPASAAAAPPAADTPAPPAAPAAEQVYRPAFHGKAGEYFKIWTVNILLTILTLGIFSAWAKVRNKRYFYGNTFIDGANFEYDASPLSILIARLIVFGALIGGLILAGEDLLYNATHSLLLAVFLPWAWVRGLAFNARYSLYRNVRFGFSKSRRVYASAYRLYSPFILIILLQYLGALGVLDFIPLSPSLSAEFGLSRGEALQVMLFFALLLLSILLLPWLLRAVHRLKISNHRWGRLPAQFAPPRLPPYMMICWALPLLMMFLIFVLTLLTGLLAGADYLPNSYTPGVILFLLSGLTFLIILFIIRAALFRLYWNAVSLPGGGRIECHFTVAAFCRLLLGNYFAVIFSLALLYPWAQVRKARFLAENMRLIFPAGQLDSILAAQSSGEGALGQEFDAAEGFDFDVGLI